MLLYWSVWSVLLALFLSKNIRKQEILLNVIIVIVAFFVGCRVDVGADWGSYIDEYYGSITEFDYFREPIFLLFAKSLCSLGFSYSWFFFLLAILQMFCLCKAAKLFRIESLVVTYLLFFSLFFCTTTLNVVRHGIMVSLVWLALGYKSVGKNKKFVICVLLGFGFHFIALILFPFLYLLDKKISMRQMLICVIMAFIVFITGISQFIFNLFPHIALLQMKMTSYINDDLLLESARLTMGQFFDLGIMLFAFMKFYIYYEREKRVRIFINSLLFAFIVNCTLCAYGIFVERISQVFKFSLIFLIPLLYQINYSYKSKPFVKRCRTTQCLSPKYRGLMIFLVTVYSFLYMNKTINTPDPLGQKQYQFRPYKVQLINYIRHDRQR